MNFSKRTDWDISENDFTLAIREARAAGRELLDLTISNPTACGFVYDSEAVLSPLSVAKALLYEPDPFGMKLARSAVAKYYADHSAQVSTDRICLTTSTSEAYSFLFRLLCEPDDEVLVARPSYPLFDFIARLDDVQLVEYPLVYDGNWHIDLTSLERLITGRTKAVIVVHPNNPTGNYASATERREMDALCVKHQLALIVDEVFIDYPIEGEAASTFLASDSKALTFVLSGVSKVCALPQMKLSWIAASGPTARVRPALERLEVIADTFLSVNAPVQHALTDWLGCRAAVQGQIRARIRENLAYLDANLAGSQASRLATDGGWAAVLRVPRHVNGLDFVAAALEHDAVVQPGEFYGLNAGHVVLSLLTPPDTWRRGIAALPIA